MPKGQWISRWPLAFTIGVFAGMRLIGNLESDFIKQIDNTIKPAIAVTTSLSGGNHEVNLGQTFYFTMSNLILILGTMGALVYFFFSVEHKGVIGGISRVGIYVLMITFGASFGYTVMGRVTLLTGRFVFLVKDWLGIIGP
jgi:hypothetical protein